MVSMMNVLHSIFGQLQTRHEVSKMSKTTKCKSQREWGNAEKRKEIHTDESAKESRAPLPLAASSHASSLRPDGETREQLVGSAKQAITTKTGVETLEDVPFLYQKGGIVSIRGMDFFK